MCCPCSSFGFLRSKAQQVKQTTLKHMCDTLSQFLVATRSKHLGSEHLVECPVRRSIVPSGERVALTSEWFQAHVRCSVYFYGFSSDAWSLRVVCCGAAMFLILIFVLTEVCFTLCINFFVSSLECYTFVFFTLVDFLLSVVISCLGKSCLHAVV